MPTEQDELTRQTIQEFFRRYTSGDLAGAADLFAEPLDLYLAGAAYVPWVGRGTTRAELLDFFTLTNEVLIDRRIVASKVLVDGEDAILLAHQDATVKANGRSFNTDFALHLTVVDGQLTRYHLYDDTLTAAESFAPAP